MNDDSHPPASVQPEAAKRNARQALMEKLMAESPPCQQVMNANLIDIDMDSGSAQMTFTMPLDFCHSGNIVQGGFVAAMIDAAMYHAVRAVQPELVAMPTLELKVSYLAPSQAGDFKARARVIKAGRSVVFIEGWLYHEDGTLTATGTSTARLILPRG